MTKNFLKIGALTGLGAFLPFGAISCGGQEESENGGNNKPSRSEANFYVLGDSLSDCGTFVAAGTEIIQKLKADFAKDSQGGGLIDMKKMFDAFVSVDKIKLPSIYYQNKFFSNGPSAAFLLAEKLKMTAEPGYLIENPFFDTVEKKGTNYAFAGAQIGNHFNFLAETIFGSVSLTKQVDALLKQHNLVDDDLIYINIGSNDFLDMVKEKEAEQSSYYAQASQPSQQAAVAKADGSLTQQDRPVARASKVDMVGKARTMVTDVSHAIQALIAKGAKKIVVSNLPDLAIAPRFASIKESIKSELISGVQAFNQGLSQTVEDLRSQNTSAKIKLHDLYNSFRKLRDDFLARGDQYQFTNATNFHIIDVLTKTDDLVPFVGNANANNLDNYFFIDPLHPTKWAHEQIALKLYEIVQEFND